MKKELLTVGAEGGSFTIFSVENEKGTEYFRTDSNYDFLKDDVHESIVPIKDVNKFITDWAKATPITSYTPLWVHPSISVLLAPFIAKSLKDNTESHLTTSWITACGLNKKYYWNRPDLNHLQIGRYAEYLCKMEFTLHGFDVYSSEVDDKGIDFVVKKGSSFFEVQTKSIRGLNYVFFPEKNFSPKPYLLSTLVIFQNFEAPKLYLIPSGAWQWPNELLVYHKYEGKKSPPEYGINISAKNLHMLEKFDFEKQVEMLK